ncbi:MAG: ABC transporter substrate-binding protein [Acidimicrobiales bacterium]|nr:ABC transporter substrate-binding protein [Acidimicrobiales bacterium]
MALLASACGSMVDSASVRANGPGAEGVASDADGSTDAGLSTNVGDGGSTPGGTAGGSAGAGGGAGGGAGTGTAAGGGTGGAGPSGASAGGTPLQGFTDDEIRIGLTAPISGLFGEVIGEEISGTLDSYFKDLNARGGIGGRKLRLIAYDDALDLTQTLINVRRLWEQDKVAMVLTTFPDGVADYVTRNKIPTFVLGFSASAFSSAYPTIFPILQSGASATYSFTYGLKEAGVPTEGMRVGMLYDTQIIDTRPYLDSAKDAWSIVGSEVVAAEPFNFADGDCTALVVKMRDLNIDWWDFEGLGWSLCVSAAQRQNYEPKVGWGNWPTNIGYLAKYAGPHVDGVWFMAPADENSGYPRQRTPEHQRYLEVLKRYHPRLTDPVHLDSVVTQTYWIVGRVIEAASNAIKDNPTQEGIIGYLQGIKNFDTGIAPPIESWAPDCKVGVNTIWIGVWRWKDGGPAREPRSGYLSNPFARERYGQCFVTELADAVVKK